MFSSLTGFRKWKQATYKEGAADETLESDNKGYFLATLEAMARPDKSVKKSLFREPNTRAKQLRTKVQQSLGSHLEGQRVLTTAGERRSQPGECRFPTDVSP